MPVLSKDGSGRLIRVGLIGAGIQMSKSPGLHEGEASAQGLAYTYELIDIAERGVGIDALPQLLAEVEASDFAGVNITHPCKQAIIPYLNDLSDDAKALGAVNTVVLSNGRRIGHNTDWYGFYENFSRGLPDVERRHALLMGAGGAGVAVAHAALKLGIQRLSILDQDRGRAAKLVSELNARFPASHADAVDDAAAVLRDADGLIHATPTGMIAHPGLPIDPGLLQPRHWVTDIVYFPLNTALLTVARQKGCRTLDGGGMVVWQAVGALRLFAGIEPDPARMRAHFEVLVAAERAAAPA